MKRKVTGFIAIAAIALLAGWNGVQQADNVKLSELALENVEALGCGEVIGWWHGNYRVTNYGCAWTCTAGGVLNCPY
ncbi:NVEALA domain-containing protein [Parabacteroides faecis]|uniref:NVEALA protein n=1 Tax=Parabacteroides faecis TaxID=1217282 RepID=A0ABR6KKF3_9BACT|nr:NVEALA domain-containing protein [Parabacteroides faecis]MBB4621992.1 hypothetical protein [Parabacteroides faecis]GGJ82210.1 hypothetical protein GCM10007084_02480 [Parabacteroides faecis]